MKVELTEQQINNLLVFLSRTQLSGQEAFVLVEIAHILQNALNKK